MREFSDILEMGKLIILLKNTLFFERSEKF